MQEILTIISVLIASCSLKVVRDYTNTTKGILETKLRENIIEIKLKIFEYSDKILNNKVDQLEIQKGILDSLYEDYRNAYEDACSKYEDKKIDRKRFEKMYKDSIKNLVEDQNHKDFYIEPQSKYTCTLKLYKKWKN